nr:NADH dehydrogenase subunit 3 [Thylacodes adamsii]
MNSVLYSSMIACFLSCLVLFLGIVLSKHSTADREKKSPFECGFDPMNNSRIPFSLRFFLLAIIFLIFDVEIVLLFPFLMVTQLSYAFISLTGAVVFLLILIFGVFYEWEEGSLDWAQ